MNSKGRRARTTARTTVRMNTGRVVGDQSVRKPRNNPCLMMKIMVFSDI